jgi:hypothetical protein
LIQICSPKEEATRHPAEAAAHWLGAHGVPILLLHLPYFTWIYIPIDIGLGLSIDDVPLRRVASEKFNSV